MNASSPPPGGPHLPEPHLLFTGKGEPHDRIARFSDAPPWRTFGRLHHLQPRSAKTITELRGQGYFARPEEIQAVNLALYLRRPLMVTGDPGTGKSTLAHAIAYELSLDEVLVWPITSRSNLQQGLYQYDAIGRLQDASLANSQNLARSALSPAPADIGRFIRLGPLGTALYRSTPTRPSVLLVDEIDKSDIDLPNDLLHVFEEGEFEIPELSRLAQDCPVVPVSLHRSRDSAPIQQGRIRCEGFPIVILTSNGEREFPPAFLRRCVRLDIKAPTPEELAVIVANRVATAGVPSADIQALIELFCKDRGEPDRELATDQLLNAVYLLTKGVVSLNLEQLRQFVLRPLTSTPVESAPASSPERPT